MTSRVALTPMMKDMFDERLAAGNIYGALILLDKHKRIPMLLNLEPTIPQTTRGHVTYWKCVADVWTGADNPAAVRHEVDRLMKSKRPYRRAMMTHHERAFLDALPDEVLVYRGVRARDQGQAFMAMYERSWTLDRELAEWFARRGCQSGEREPWLGTMRVEKKHVLAYMTERNESEVLLDLKRGCMGHMTYARIDGEA